MNNHIECVIEKVSDGDKITFETYFRQGEEKITYGDLSGEDLSYFAKACMQQAGVLANLAIIELKREQAEKKKDKKIAAEKARRAAEEKTEPSLFGMDEME